MLESIEPIEPKETQLVIENFPDLAKALDKNRLPDLSIDLNALSDLMSVANLIEANYDSLTELRLTGPLTLQYTEHVKSLVTAITKCTKLKVLAMVNFGMSLDASITSLITCTSRLPDLQELNLSDTLLGVGAIHLPPIIAQHPTLKCLNLTGTGLITPEFWTNFGIVLGENPKLAELILRGIPISPHAVRCLAQSLYSYNVNLLRIDWPILNFEENETLFIKYAQLLNIEKLSLHNKTVDLVVADLINYRTTQEHPMLAAYKSACKQHSELQNNLTERLKPSSESELVFGPPEQGHFNLEATTIQIYLQRQTLISLTIRCGVMERINPTLDNSSQAHFRNVLKNCIHLECLEILQLQASLEPPRIRDLLIAISALPNLKKLHLNKTYLGEAGVTGLCAILAKNKLIELDLTLAGLFNDFCFRTLVQALINNTSVKTLILGRSPMADSWMELLASAVIKRALTNPINIIYIYSEKLVMDAQMSAMCSDLGRSQHALSHKTDTALNAFLGMPPSTLAQTWQQVRNHSEAHYQQPHPIFSGNHKKRDALPEEHSGVSSQTRLNTANKEIATYGTLSHTKP